MLVLALVGAMSLSLSGSGCDNGIKCPPSSSGPDGGSGDAPDADSGDAAGAAAGAGFDTFLEQVAKAACSWQFRCCSLPEIDALAVSSYLTETECVAQSILQLRVFLSAERAALLDGRLTLDVAKAGACGQQLTARACNTLLELEVGGAIGLGTLLGVCKDPFVGQTPVGARCTNLRECVSGSVCAHFDGSDGPHGVDLAGLSASPPLGSPVSFEGVCIADQQEGQPCALTQHCQAGLYCRRTDFVCAAPAREGEPCVSVAPGTEGPAGPPIICGTGATPLVCVADVCRRLPHQGEPCLSTISPDRPATTRCDPTPALDLTCVGSELGGDGVCKKTAGPGAPCGGFAIPPCSVSLQCALSDGGDLGTCQELPGVGEPCPGFTCRAPAVCYTQTMTCVAPPVARYGSKCQSDLDCSSLSCASRFDADDSKTCAFSTAPILCTGAGTNPIDGNNPPPRPPPPSPL